MNYTIRTATWADLPRILKIYEGAREFMRESGNPTQWGHTHPAEQLLREDIPLQRLFVCTEGPEILAVFFYEQGVDPCYVDIQDGQWLNDEPYGVIHRIAVAQPGKGVAGACFDWALNRCRNLRIDTHRDNIPMQKALKKHGFVPCGTVYVGDHLASVGYHKVK